MAENSPRIISPSLYLDMRINKALMFPHSAWSAPHNTDNKDIPFPRSRKHSPCTGEPREYTVSYMSDSWKPNIRAWIPARSSLMGPSAANSVALLQIDPSVSPSSSSPRRVKVTLGGKGERDIYLQLLSDIRSHSHGEEVT